MDVQAMQDLVRGIVGSKSAPRRPHGFWVPYAWTVRVMVDQQKMGVCEACRTVMQTAAVDLTPNDMACLRVIYYKIRKQPWPVGLAGVVDAALNDDSDEETADAEDTADESVEEPADAEDTADESVEEPADYSPDTDADPDYQPDDEEFEV